MTAAIPSSEIPPPWRRSEGVPKIRRIAAADLVAALTEGWADFRAAPVYGLVFGALYALGGCAMIWLLAERDLRGLVFPLIAGFALVGPFAGVALYEVSRRRELGLPVAWRDLGAVMKGASRRSIMMLGFVLMFWLAVWSRVGVMLYALFFGLNPPPLGELLPRLLTSVEGLQFLIVGHLSGAFFAAVAFAISAISFPFLLDRDADFITAIVASVTAVRMNPGVMLLWAVLIGATLAVASAPLFLGLPLALPVLAHASWRLYRRLAE